MQASTELVVLFNLLNKLQRGIGQHEADEFSRVGLTVRTEGSQAQKFGKLAMGFHAECYELAEQDGKYTVLHNGTAYESPFTKEIFEKMGEYKGREQGE